MTDYKRQKYFWLAIGAGLLLWHAVLRRPAYQYWYGQPAALPEDTPQEESIVPLDEENWQAAKVGEYEILFRRRRQYAVLGRVVFVDHYDGWLKTWYLSAGRKAVKLYNAVAPFDLSIIHGETAADGNWQKIDFDHEERALLWRYASGVRADSREINNNHSIPASENVRAALKILRAGEKVYAEGYLVDWKGSGEFAQVEFDTALEAGEISKQRLGGSLTGLCRQFLITKIVFDGYVFE